ncbi:amidohydrolase family protein [Mycobacterium sp. 48b]|uniref:amidohydrolase family protein n=1 Tax=Mycobacterium sp. 48b TaxID=3400426 RepID=UPI003AAA6AE3
MTTIDQDYDPLVPLARDHPLLEPIAGLPVIDVDTHLTEPGDLWTSRAPEKYKHLMPRVEYVSNERIQKELGWKPDGSTESTPVWVVGDNTLMTFAGGASVINKSNQKVKGSEFIHWPLTDVSPAVSLVEPRLALMDDCGILGQIMYPNAVGFGGQALAAVTDPEVRLAIFKIWNDAMHEMQVESGGRIMGMGLIPWWDTKAAVAEIERVAGLGLHGLNTNADPQNQGLPDLSDPVYTEMWEACEHFDLPVNFHIGASVSQSSYMGTAPWPSLDNDTKLALGSAMLYIGNSRVIANFIYSGLLDRHPKLKLVSVESGIGWIPFILEALDYQADENNVHHLELKASEYFSRQMYACFWFESGQDFMHYADRLGVDNVMFETDFPHPTCLYPQPLLGISEVFEKQSVAPDTRAKIIGGNAAKVYNIDIAKLEGKK